MTLTDQQQTLIFRLFSKGCTASRGFCRLVTSDNPEEWKGFTEFKKNDNGFVRQIRPMIVQLTEEGEAYARSLWGI